TPFEWMVKVAASIGDYAQRRNYALHLLADESAWAPPPGPISRTALLEYLARVQPTGRQSLAALLTARPAENFVAVVLPWPDPALVESVLTLKQLGCEVLVAALDPASFPGGGPSAASLVEGLTGANVEARLIRFGSDWTEQLAMAGGQGASLPSGERVF